MSVEQLVRDLLYEAIKLGLVRPPPSFSPELVRLYSSGDLTELANMVSHYIRDHGSPTKPKRKGGAQ